MLSFAAVQQCHYIEETPVKLLTARLFGSQYPAAGSEHRLSLEGGVDQDVLLDDHDVANDLPDQQLLLSPGGRAVFLLPIEADTMYLMIKPGKKDNPYGSPFSEKANITITAAPVEGGEGISITCGKPSSDMSSLASDYCVLSLEPLGPQNSIVATIQIQEGEVRDAAIWQLHVSPLDDSDRVKGLFEEDGRQLMRKTQTGENSNTWLTMASIVGKTGVGKSTCASMLSGNDSMFSVGSKPSGTTTIGADISTIIPSDQYKATMEGILQQDEMYAPDSIRPIFLIDSEGMSFRGDEVDFVTTGPVAIIADIIIWVTTDRMRPPDVLGDILEYLNGLDRISFGDGSSQEQDYGQFIVLLNKMQDSDQDYTDEELCASLMAWGSSPEDDAVRGKLLKRFKEIACIGLPLVHLEEGEDFGYSVIQRYPRFIQGLYKLGNRLLQATEERREVRVGTEQYVMNSTQAETIIGMLIDGANMGNIDLSDPCNVLYSLNKERIIQHLARTDDEILEASNGKCSTDRICSKCVCEYMNSAVEYTENILKQSVINSVIEADILCPDDQAVGRSIESLVMEYIEPWTQTNVCSGVAETTNPDCDICDISDIDFEKDSLQCSTLHICGKIVIPNKALTIVAHNMFIGLGSDIEQEAPVKAASGEDATAESEFGLDGEPGEIGRDVSISASGILLTGSEIQLSVTLHGGDGGDGGKGGNGKAAVPGLNGKDGEAGADGKNGTKGQDGTMWTDVPTTDDAHQCQDVILRPEHYAIGGVVQYGKSGHCCCFFKETTGLLGFMSDVEAMFDTRCCHTYRYYQKYGWKYNAVSPCDNLDGKPGGDGASGGDGTDATPAEDATQCSQGGDGGKGGGGGPPGNYHFSAEFSLEVVLHRVGGKGGIGGAKGIGGLGAEGGRESQGGRAGIGGTGGEGGAAGQCVAQQREWTAQDNWHSRYDDCSWCHCSTTSHVPDPCSNFAPGAQHPVVVEGRGVAGVPGQKGGNGTEGKSYPAGQPVEACEDGSDGEPGEDAVTLL